MINQGMWNDNPFDSWTEEEEHLSNMGVISFGKGGGPPPTPAHTTTQTTSQYPDELKPFIADIFGKAKGIEDQRSADGYQAYDAPRIAGFNQDQQDAFTGIRDAQGASTPYFEAQETLIDRSTAGPSAARTAQYMNPYTQNVIDIQQRELGRMGEQERNKIGAGAANAGSFGGSRQAILEAEQMRNQGMRSDDIQAKGMNQAYAQAQQSMSQADARGLQGAGMYGQMGTQVPGQRMKELGALAGVGAADQTQQQRALDLGYRQFQDEYNYPMKTLNDYSAILRGFPLPANTSSNQTSYSAVAPLSSQLLGAGAGLTGMAGMAGLFGASGGQVKKLQQGGLASMYAPSNRVRMGKTNYKDATAVKPYIDYKNTREYPNTPAGRASQERAALEAIIKKESAKSRQSDQDPFDNETLQEALGEYELSYGVGPIAEPDGSFNRTKDPVVLQDEFEFNVLENPTDDPLSGQTPQEAAGKRRVDKYDNTDRITVQGTNEIEAMTEGMEKRAEKKEKKATLDERRMRIARYGPLLQNARAIAEAPTLSSALLTGLETAGDSMAGEIAAEEAVLGRASAIRGADIAEMAALAGIQKDLSRDALAIEFLKVAQDLSARGDTEGAAKYAASSEALTNNTVDFGEDIAYLKNKDKVLAAIQAAGDTDGAIPMMFKEGGRIGGTPERSFDFIPKDGKLIAVPK